MSNCCSCVQIPNDSRCYDVLLVKYHPDDSSVLSSSELDDIIDAIGIGLRDEVCQSLSVIISCFYEFPSCNVNTSEVLPICPDRCPEIQAAHQYCFPGHVPERFGNFTQDFNCSILESYYFNYNNATISNISCSKFMYVHIKCTCIVVPHQSVIII